jgi:hypothetical protein
MVSSVVRVVLLYSVSLHPTRGADVPPDTATDGQNDRVKTPIRTIRIPDDPWLDAQTASVGRPERVPYVVQLALSAYAKDPSATLAALMQIRDGVR